MLLIVACEFFFSGRNWNVLSYTPIKSIPNMCDMSSEEVARTEMFSAPRNCVTWCRALSYCKWWSHQIRTGFLTHHTPLRKQNLNISECIFIVNIKMYTWAMFMLSNQNVDMPHLCRGIDYLDTTSATSTDLCIIRTWNGPFMYVNKVLHLYVQLSEASSHSCGQMLSWANSQERGLGGRTAYL